jgi:DNA-binding transcriptional regulator YiaG
VKTRYDTAKNKLKPICAATLTGGNSNMNSTIYSQIGLRVRQLRRQQHRSQDELSVWLRAFHAPITRDMIANWETGRAVVPAVYIPVLAYALKVEVADILPRLTLKDLKAGQIMPVFRRPRGRPPTHL